MSGAALGARAVGGALAWFRDAARERPERVALRGAGGERSWGRLATDAARIAAALDGAPSGPVATLLPPDAGLVTAAFGAWLAGRVIVPLDPSFPAARLAALLADVGAGSLVTTDACASLAEEACARAADVAPARGAPRVSRLAALLDGAGAAARSVSGDASSRAADDGAPAAASLAGPDALACVLYTSGSTGTPRGVCHTHRSLLANADARVAGYALSEDDRLAALYAPSTGGLLATVLSALRARASVHLLDPRAGVDGVPRAVREDGVTVLALIASSLRALLPTAADGDLRGLRLLSLSGESLRADDLVAARRLCGPDAGLVNSYATTETGTACRWTVPPGAERDAPPLGRVADGVELAVLDEDDRPAAPGATGRVAVRGTACSVGVWDPAARAPRPWPGVWIPTGDLGVLDADGVLHHRGRADDAVNVDGRVVHLRAVEAAVAALPEVADVAVVAEDAPGGPRLVAHVVPTPGAAVDATAWRARLAADAPLAATPSRFEAHASLPRLPGGKVDRRTLAGVGAAERVPGGDGLAQTTDAARVRRAPHAGAAPPASGPPTAAPRNETELRVAALFEEVLGDAPVGAADDFFDRGGHSLLAVRLLGAIEQRFGRRLALQDLLAAPTVAALARHLDDDPALAHTQCVRLRDGDEGLPVVLVCGLFLYRHLAQALPAGRAVHAVFVQSELDALRGGRGAATVEAMAAEYLAEIRGVLPTGPFHVVGESFGGLVAFELGHALRNAGEEVGLVGLLDTAPPRLRRVDHLGRLAHHLRRARRRWTRDVRDDPAPTSNGRPADARSSTALAREARLEEARSRTYRAARRRYDLAAYSGPLALYRSLDRPEFDAFHEDPVAVWRDVGHGPFTCREVPGTHLGILRPPHVSVLARALDEDMRAVEAARG